MEDPDRAAAIQTLRNTFGWGCYPPFADWMNKLLPKIQRRGSNKKKEGGKGCP